MILTVLSDLEQYTALKGKYDTFNGLRILCDNPNLYGFLEENNIGFDKLDEELIKDRWSEINKWACEKALDWGKYANLEKYFGAFEIDKSMYIMFSYMLTSLMKNFFYSDYITSNYRMSKVLIFNCKMLQYPQFNGNYFLNKFLKKRAIKNGVKIDSIDVLYPKRYTKKDIKKTFKKVTQTVYASFSRLLKRKYSCIFYGSLNHLQELIVNLKDKKKTIALFDHEYNFQKHLFATRNNIGYYVTESFSNMPFDFSCLSLKGEWKKGIRNSLAENRFFSFNEIDFTEDVWCMVLDVALDTMEKKLKVAQNYNEMLKRFTLKYIVVDEDVSYEKSSFVAFFKALNIPIFCVSHGYMLTNFSVDKKYRKFSLSTTFINSEFEKSLYLDRGWDPGDLVVTGIPRYDRLIAMNKNTQRKEHERKMKILYCASSLLEDNPKMCSYLGIHRRQNGSMIVENLRDSIEAVADKHIELLIKPHDEGEEGLWANFIKQNTKNSNIKIISAKVDFFKLLLDCNAMISSYWSAAINESAILNIPTVVADYYGGGDLHPDAGCGLFDLARNRTELKSKLDKYYKNFIQNQIGANYYTNKDFNFYLGKCDEGNSERIANYILSKI